MTFDQAQSARLGQRTAVESTYVRMFDGDELPEAAWPGQLIFRSDVKILQVFNGEAWEDVAGGVAGQLTFIGDTEPVAQSIGDTWYDTSDSMKLYVWDGTDWQVAVAGAVAGTVTEYSVSASETVPPPTGWSTNTPVRTPGTFIWVRTTSTRIDGSSTRTNPALMTGNTGEDGAQGPPGPTGSQGVPGPAGEDGTPMYTWVKYADTPNSGMSDFPAGKDYMGIAVNQTDPTESSDYLDYKWTLTKGEDGTDGADGIPGDPGEDGVTHYTWIRYADDILGSGISNSSVGKTYMGIAYNKSTPTESTDPAQYEWSLIQGPQGATGPQGPQGSQGQPGPTGSDGTTYYTWLKYASSATPAPADMSDLPAGKTYMGIAPNKTTATESTVYTDYTWSLIQGPPGTTGSAGADGVGITGTTVTYQLGSSGTTAPTGTWQSSPQATSPGQFLWTRTITTYSSGSPTTAYSVSAHGSTGAAGSAGADGVGITGTTVAYQVGNSGTTAPSSTWSPTPVATTAPGQYLWTRTITTYSAGNPTTAYAVSAHGSTGSQGVPGNQGIPGTAGADGVTTYTWVKYSPVANPTDGQMSDIPGTNAYIGMQFNKTTATEGTVASQYSWSLIKGADGATGPQGPQGPAGPTGPAGPVGPATDGHAPASSPAATVIGGLGALFVRWPAISNHDPVSYDVHLSATSGFTPSGSTYAGSTAATSMTLRTMPDGSAMAYVDANNTPVIYYVRVVAYDADNYAAAGVEGSGSMVQVSGPDVAADYVYANTIIAEQIEGGTIISDITVSSSIKTAQSGQRVEMNSAGITLWGPDGITTLTSIPTDPQKPVFLKGTVELDVVNINGNLSLRGTTNEISKSGSLALAGKVNNPQTPPTVQLDWDTVQTWVTDWSNQYGLTWIASLNCYGSVNSLYGASLFLFGANGGYGGNIPCPERPGTRYFAPQGGLTWIGGFLYVLGLSQPTAGGAQTWELRKFSLNTSTMALTFVAASRTYNISNKLPAIGNDGAAPCMAFYGADNTLRYSSIDPTTLEPTNTVLSPTPTPMGSAVRDLSYVQRSTFDFGAARTMAAHRSSDYNVYAYTTSARSPNDDFPTANKTSAVRGAVYGGPDGMFHTINGAGQLVTYSPINWTTESANWYASYVLADTNAGGTGTHQTGGSAKQPFTMVKRSVLSMTSPTIQNVGGPDDPDSVRFYLGRGTSPPVDTSMFLNASPPSGVTSAALRAVAFSGGTLPSNNFPSSGAAKVVDSSGNTLMDATGYSMFAPTGTIQMFAGGTVPTGWLFCDGTPKSRVVYAALYAVILNTYGAGDGTTTFNLPNFAGKVPRGSTPGVGAGADTVTMPDHTHPVTAQAGTGGNTRGTATPATPNVPSYSDFNAHNHGGVTGAVSGTNPAIANIPSYTGVQFMIKT